MYLLLGQKIYFFAKEFKATRNYHSFSPLHLAHQPFRLSFQPWSPPLSVDPGSMAWGSFTTKNAPMDVSDKVA